MIQTRNVVAALAFGLVAVIGTATLCRAQPTADEVLGNMGFTAADKQKIMAGDFVTGQADSVADQDLSVSMAFLAKATPDSLAKQVMATDFVSGDSQVKAFGSLGGPGAAADFARLKLTDSVAKTFQNAQAGEDINLSTAEIAAFGAVQGGTPAVEVQLRSMLLTRYRAYLASGLAGIAPYDRGGKNTDVGAELRKASSAAKGLGKYLPSMQAVMLGYPKSTIPGMSETFRWMQLNAHDTPTVVLTHVMAAPDGAARVVVQRQFYVSTGYNAEQAVAGFLPVQEGTIVAYSNHTFTDQVAGFGSSMKRGIGERLMVEQLQKVFAADRAKVAH